jgi:hypothetical protein
MKKKIFTTILILLMYFMLTSCIACMQSSRQCEEFDNYTKEYTEEYASEDLDTLDKVSQNLYDTTVIYLSKEIEQSAKRLLKEPSSLTQDTIKRAIFKKDIKPIEVDTSWKMEREKSYRQLEKIEKDLENQHDYIDSLLIIKKR